MSPIFHRSASPPPAPPSPRTGAWNARVPLWVLVELFVAFLSVRQRMARRRQSYSPGRDQ